MRQQCRAITNTKTNANQSNYGVLGKLRARSIVLGPLGIGKPVMLNRMTPGVYKGCLTTLNMRSPSKYANSERRPVRNIWDNI